MPLRSKNPPLEKRLGLNVVLPIIKCNFQKAKKGFAVENLADNILVKKSII